VAHAGNRLADYAALQILADVLASQRADIYGMVPAGKALAAEFGIAENYPKASVGYGVVALPAGQDATPPLEELRQIGEQVRGQRRTGGPGGRGQARGDAQAEFQRNSIPDLAAVWSDALAARGATHRMRTLTRSAK